MPTLGLVAATLALAYFTTRFGRIGASGVLVGLGTGVVVITGQAQIRCALASGCTAPDVTALFLLASAVIAIGVTLGAVRLKRVDP